ncbi:MAG TPA: alpha/beta fold hydrolase [Candidatus Binatia bacterium]|nr:alpha/beta fold hydrolase [Candidatus Binatia bacterium]
MSLHAEQALCFVADGLQLEGRLALPSSASRAAVICHPHPQYGGDMHNNVVATVTAGLSAAGVATLRFNFRGVGASEGAYANGVGEANDARAAIAFLRNRLDTGAISLVGYSFGAYVALLAGHDHPDVARLVAIAPPVAMIDVSFLNECRIPKLLVVGERDQYCPPTTLERFFNGLSEPKSCVQLPGDVDHFFFGHESAVAAHVIHFVTAEQP